LSQISLICTQKTEAEGVKGVVHTIGQVLPIHHVLPLHTIGHVAGSVASHTIGQIMPIGKSKENKEKKKKRMTVDIKSLKCVHLSIDTVQPKNLNLQVELVSAYSHNNKKSNIENNPDNFEEKLENGNSDDDDDDEIERAAALIVDEKKKNKTSVTKMSLNSFSTGQSAVKSVIKMSNPAKHLSHTFVVIKGVHLTHTTKKAYGKRPVWGESVYMDVNEIDFEFGKDVIFENTSNSNSRGDGILSGGNRSEKIDSNGGEKKTENKNNESQKSADSNVRSSGGHSDHGFQVFLYRGVSGMETLVGYQYVPFSLLLPGRSSSSMKTNIDNSSSHASSHSSNSARHTDPASSTAHTAHTGSASTVPSNTNKAGLPPPPLPAVRIDRCPSDASLSSETYSQSGSGEMPYSLLLLSVKSPSSVLKYFYCFSSLLFPRFCYAFFNGFYSTSAAFLLLLLLLLLFLESVSYLFDYQVSPLLSRLACLLCTPSAERSLK
jgi:hypothetical protein